MNMNTDITQYIPTGERNAASIETIAEAAHITIEEALELIGTAMKNNVVLRFKDAYFQTDSATELLDFCARNPREFNYTSRLWRLKYVKVYPASPNQFKFKI